MKWHFPAKTFLLGEYLALQQGPALLVTTSPCFSLTLTAKPGLEGLHPDSPAGRLWQTLGLNTYGLSFVDPYQGCGGLGASSAQFLGTYFAKCFLQQQPFSLKGLLTDYYQFAFQGQGIRPSGYDVIAQACSGCVFIEGGQVLQSCAWPFPDLSFILLHTGTKLATHQHLQSLELSKMRLESMAAIVLQAQQAFEKADSRAFIACVQQYQQQLEEKGLVAGHSLDLIQQLLGLKEILAIKGCGALGADVLLLLVSTKNKKALLSQLGEAGYRVLATEAEYFKFG